MQIVHSGFVSLFIFDWCDRKGPYQRVIRMLELPSTIDPQFRHTKHLLEFKAVHNQMSHNMFFCDLHKLSPIQNHKACRLPKIYSKYTWDITIFSGLISRWPILFSWRYWIADAICLIFFETYFSPSVLFFLRWVNNVPYSIYSKTR